MRTLDGTVALFDLSGFTRLTERMDALGPAGGELMGQAIDDVFAPLIDVLLRGGGDVLKFGGDALLVLFTGPDHAVRAVGAGAALQRILRRLGRIETPIGPVRLRMKGGLHSGLFTFVATGSTHRELLLAGRDASTVVRMEGRSGPGQLVVSAATAAAVPATWTSPCEGGGATVRLGRVEAGPAGAAPRRDRVRGDLSRLVPVALEPYLGRDELGDHRRLAVAFVGLDGSDELADAGSAALLERIEDVVAAIDTVVADLGVCWLKSDIGVDQVRFVLATGLPRRSDDDDGRMLNAVRLIADRCGGLRVGVHSGAVFVADVGHEQRRGYDLWGDVPNVAARLMIHAEPGTIRASQDVLARARTRFHTAPLAPFRVKGKRAPLHAAVLGSAADPPGPVGDDLPLIGRDAEVTTLHATVELARAGQGSVLQVTGEAGAGKSRLVAEVRAALGDVAWVTARGDAYEIARPYRAFTRVLRAALLGRADADAAGSGELAAAIDAHRGSLGPWTPLLGAALGVAVADSEETARIDPAFVRPKLHEVVIELLATSARRPVVIECEDLQWFDDASVELTRDLAREAPERGWLLLAVSRPEGPIIDRAASLELGALDPADATSFALAAAGSAPLERDEAARLAARAGGNPLFLRELTRVAIDTGAALPDTLERAVGARLDTLGAADRRLLREVSVAGTAAALPLLAAVLGREDLDGALGADNLGTFVVVEDEVLRFRHDVIRAVAYDGLPFRRRRELHGRLADELVTAGRAGGAEPVAAMVARHYHDADRPADAWRWLPEALDLARRSAGWIELTTLLEMALGCAASVADAAARAAELAEELGDVSERLGHNDRALAVYANVKHDAADDGLTVARVLRKEGRVLERAGRYVDSLRRLSRAERLLDGLGDGPAVLAARVDTRLAQSVTRFFQGRFAACIELAELALADATLLGDRRAIAQAHLQLEMACSELGRPERAAHGARALALFAELDDDLGLGNLLLNLGVSAYNESEWDTALDCYRRSSAAYERAGDVVGAASTVNNEAEILTDQGRYGEAAERLARAARMYRAAHYASGEAVTTSGRSRLELRAGRVDVTLHLLAQARQRFVELGAASFVVDTDVRRVEALVIAGLSAEALELATATRTDLASHGDVAILPITLERLAATALAQLGRRAEGRATLAAALDRARQDAVPFEVLQLLVLGRLIGRPGGDDAADDDEIAQLRARLGIVDLPEPPLARP